MNAKSLFLIVIFTELFYAYMLFCAVSSTNFLETNFCIGIIINFSDFDAICLFSLPSFWIIASESYFLIIFKPILLEILNSCAEIFIFFCKIIMILYLIQKKIVYLFRIFISYPNFYSVYSFFISTIIASRCLISVISTDI